MESEQAPENIPGVVAITYHSSTGICPREEGRKQYDRIMPYHSSVTIELSNNQRQCSMSSLHSFWREGQNNSDVAHYPTPLLSVHSRHLLRGYHHENAAFAVHYYAQTSRQQAYCQIQDASLAPNEEPTEHRFER